MSVIEYGLEKIEQIYADVWSVVSRLPLCSIPEDKLQQTFRGAYYANQAAFACTYNDAVKIKRFELNKSLNPSATYHQVYKDIAMLLYNCISNGGRDFLPQKDREALEAIQTNIAWHLVEEKERKTCPSQ